MNYLLLRTATAPTNFTKWPVRIRIEVGMFDYEFGECIGEVLSSAENSSWIYLRQTGQCGSGPALTLSDKQYMLSYSTGGLALEFCVLLCLEICCAFVTY